MTKLEQIAKVFNDWIEDLRAQEKRICNEVGVRYNDPFSDTRVIINETHVLVAYDGTGYDYLSINSAICHPITGEWFRPGEKHQEALNDQLRAIDPELGIENVNSWSLGVWI
jgi:hypothetical protein